LKSSFKVEEKILIIKIKDFMCDKLVLLKFLIISCICIFTGYAVAGQTPHTMPVAYTSATNINSIRSWDAVKPSLDVSTITSQLTRDVRQTAGYFDGLGRPIQTVSKLGSLETATGNNVDLVTATDYDSLGREVYKYLPFVSTATDGTQNNGLFKLNPFQQQAAFYDNAYASSPIKGQGETFFYDKVSFEPSPLNRVQETFAPGNSWSGTADLTPESSRHSVKMKYYLNTVTDSVRIWNVTNNATIGQFGTYASTGTYAAGLLFKNIAVDEQGNQVIEFKDKDGKVLLKKVQLSTAPGIADDGTGRGYTGWLSTYYIYDDLNQLRCVIQPRGIELVAATAWALTDPTILAEQCFRYEYDDRNHIIVKKVPGAGEVYMVYDAKDRLVLMQDANMRTGTVKWMYTQYDVLNRPIVTGLWNDASSFTTHYNGAYNSSSYPTLTGTTEELTRTFYDNYDWRASWGSPLTNTYNNTHNTYFQTSSNTTWPYPQANVQSTQITGLATGTRIKVLGTASTYLFTVNIYDAKGRLIQVQTQNNTGGTDIATTQYSWAGQPLIVVLKQEKAGTNAQTTVLVTQLTYDDLGRAIKTEKKLSNTQYNSNAMSAYVSIAENQYNAIGQLKTKKLAPAYNSNAGIETLNYDYNIRGWLLGENRDYVNDINTTNYFGFDLGYDKNGSLGTYIPQYNGNISGTIWKSKGDNQKRKYDFIYDAVNRLTGAGFNQYVSGSGTSAVFDKSAGVDFSVANLSYDANGNIMTMNQNGLKLNTSSPIDQLSYNYQTNSNKLQQVTDAANDNTSTLGDFKYDPAGKGATDYSYDANGNLTLDNNKNISSITYNYLNLPSVITVTGKGSITYTYDASGNKLQKTTIDNTVVPSKTTITSYIAGFVYQNDTLQFMSHEEGRIRRKIDGSFAYDYFLKDHLGNVRMVLTDEVSTNYYPAATLEGTYDASSNSMVNYEKQFYKIDNTKITPESAIASWVSPAETVANTKLYYNNNGNPPPNTSYPAGCTPTQTAGSNNVYKLNAAINRTGLEFMIHVMAGDHIDIFSKSYYLNTASITNTNSTTLDVLSLMANMLLAPANAAAAKGITASQLSTINTGIIPSSFFRGNNSEPATTIPKAYVNYIFFDEQFKYAGGGASRVGTSGSVKDHWYVDAQLQNITVPKNGYIFVYVSNESNLDVFFDNLQVIHKPGPILEETHYYPFGLSMAGISSKALNGAPENKYKWNKGSELQNKEFSDGSGLELYATNFRSLDPQLGRFWQTDPKPDYAQSLYSAMNNNPISFNDPLGDTIRTSFRTGFLGIFGKKANLTYDEKNQRWNNKDGSAYTGKTNKFSNMVLGDLKTNQKNELGNTIVTNLATDKLDHNIKRGDPNSNRTDDPNIYYSGSHSDNQKILEGGAANSSPSYVVLGHEMAHKFDQNLGIVNKYWFGATGEERGVDEYNAMYYENVLRQANGLPRRAAYQEINGVTQGTILDAAGNLQPMPAGLSSQGVSLPAFHALQLFLRIF